MSPVLSSATLASTAAPTKPTYDRSAVACGIVHLGIGAFHRAHQAVYTDSLLAAGDLRWGIVGASLRSPRVRNSLAPQDYLYTVLPQPNTPTEPRIIGSIQRILALPEPGQLQQLLDTIAKPATQVITLTVTEKGYCHDHQGKLDFGHPDIAHDLANPEKPTSAPGVLALAIAQRSASNASGITVLSCDNLANNGMVAQSVVGAMVNQAHPQAAGWMADNVRFPASMVDRIVPQLRAQDVQDFEDKYGYGDNGLVLCEPYSQWVIEDNFAGKKPAWDSVGAQFVTHVRPYEQAKLSLLNATHSALAYLGILAGYEFIHEAIADPHLEPFARSIMDHEITPVVEPPEGLDLTRYKQTIRARFANPHIAYRTAQVASDGSQKLPQRILPNIERLLRNRSSATGLTLVVAAWIQCTATAVPGVDDPASEQLVALAREHPSAKALVHAIATRTNHLGELAEDAAFCLELTSQLQGLRTQGSLDMARGAATASKTN